MIKDSMINQLTWMSHRTSQIDQTSLSQKNDVISVLQREPVDLQQSEHTLR